MPNFITFIEKIQIDWIIIIKYQGPIKESVLSRSICLKITLFLEFLVCI